MNFNEIVMDNWGRKPYFEHYIHSVRCSFSMTAELDITRLLEETKGRGIKLYPALIYMIATVVNRHVEFRTCYHQGGTLGYWDRMSPSYTIFHDDDKTFSSLWTSFGDDDFDGFYGRYLEDMKRYGSVKQLAAKPDEPPNTFPVSSIPWVNFTGFNLNVYNEGTYLLPILTMGKYVRKDGRVLIPLSGKFHHAVCDGYHAGLLYNELQALADACMEWLPDTGNMSC